jgi:hypothetical protein
MALEIWDFGGFQFFGSECNFSIFKNDMLSKKIQIILNYFFVKKKGRQPNSHMWIWLPKLPIFL